MDTQQTQQTTRFNVAKDKGAASNDYLITSAVVIFLGLSCGYVFSQVLGKGALDDLRSDDDNVWREALKDSAKNSTTVTINTSPLENGTVFAVAPNPTSPLPRTPQPRIDVSRGKSLIALDPDDVENVVVSESTKAQPILIANVKDADAPALAFETKIYSASFKPGSIELSPEEKRLFLDSVKMLGAADAAKIHVQGVSGNRSVPFKVRRKLAFNRAWEIKTILVEEFQIAPKKIRLFTFTTDHNGTPRAVISVFDTEEAAQADADRRLGKNNG